MKDYAEGMKVATIDKQRKEDPELWLNEEEVKALRSGTGGLSWLVRNGRMDLAVRTQRLQQSQRKAQIKHLLEMNQAIREAKKDADIKTKFPAGI